MKIITEKKFLILNEKGKRFTVDEDMIILQQVVGTTLPTEISEIKSLFDRKKSWKDLKSKIERSGYQISKRWSGFIHPTILSYLSGTLRLKWRKNFFQFIIDNKCVSNTDIDWNVVLEKWPSCTLDQLRRIVISFNLEHGKKGVCIVGHYYEFFCISLSELALSI